jgi:trans-2,3-dihydro-3-hydroxyanthranilate isomerase
MKLRFHTLDVFTARRFGGNPLAVVLGADALDDRQMQTIAREFNLSETIFVRQAADPGHTASVRIFFPTGEIPFAGHPTVGCAILLAELKHKPGCSFETEITLEEVAGLVPVRVSRIGDVPRAMFTAPVVPFPSRQPRPERKHMAQALSLEEEEVGFEGHEIGLYEGGPRFLFAPVRSRTALVRARIADPIWSEISRTAGTDGVYVYAAGGEKAETSYRARMFAPASGIPEDPATGSASALLAAQLLASGALREGTNRLQLQQGYEMGRPSDIALEADVAAGALQAVRIAGQAVRVMEGTLSVE